VDNFGQNIRTGIETFGTAGIETEIKASGFNSNIPPLFLVWLAGFLLGSVYFAVSHIRFRKKHAASVPVCSAFVADWKTRRTIKIRQSDLLVSPLTYGIFRPVILLPKTTDYSDEKKLEYILMHEYTHIRRFDTLSKLLLAAAVLVFMVGALFAALQSCGGDEAEEPFVMQEPTDRLVVYKYYDDVVLTAALNIFETKYPDVEIEIRDFDGGWGAYKETLKTELAAGKGPDLIFGTDFDYPDIYKSMDSGVFLDLNPLIDSDDEFNLDDYVKVALDAGVYKGKRYVMPVEYYVPILLTTKEILDAESITPSDLATFDGFIGTVNKYHEKYKDDPDKMVFFKYPWPEQIVRAKSGKRIQPDENHFVKRHTGEQVAVCGHARIEKRGEDSFRKCDVPLLRTARTAIYGRKGIERVHRHTAQPGFMQTHAIYAVLRNFPKRHGAVFRG